MNNSDYIAIIAVIVAFLSLGAQIYVGKKDVGATLYQHVTSLFNNLNAPFLEHPELRPYFYENRSPHDLSAENQHRALVIAEMFLDTFEWVEHDITKAKKVDKDSWRDYMLDVYASSIIVRNFHEKNPSWHPLFDALVQKTLKKER